MHALEASLGHSFSSPALLEEALTHPSVAYESHRHQISNQRLEFLGDAEDVDPIFAAALRLDLGKHLVMGRGEAACGGRERASTLSDALEALVGAIYLDAGMETARATVLRLCGEELSSLTTQPREVNPKGQLQETLQSVALGSPSYSIVSEAGPDHRKSFVARVTWNGLALADGSGPSKKLAETAAAEAALAHPEVVAISIRLATAPKESASPPAPPSIQPSE